MSNNRSHIKSSSIFLIGVPILLLFISIFFLKNDNPPLTELAELNPYRQTMPEAYLEALQQKELKFKNKKNDSFEVKKFITFFIDNNFQRELIVLIAQPKKEELSNDFKIEVYPSEKKRLPQNRKGYQFNLVNNAKIYNHAGVEYGAFKFVVPLIDMDSLSVTQVHRNKKLKPWQTTLANPFPKLTITKNKTTVSGQRKIPNIYRPFMNSLLRKAEITFIDHDYKIINDSLFEIKKTKEKFIKDASATIVTVKNTSRFWRAINNHEDNLIDLCIYQGPSVNKAKSLFQQYIEKNIDFNAVFDVDKLAHFVSILNLFTDECSNEKLLFIFNEETNRLEPFFHYDACVGKTSKYVDRMPTQDPEFIQNAGSRLKAYANLDLKLELQEDESLINHIKLINSYYPDNIFNLDFLKVNQLKIKKNLEQSIAIKAELISMSDDRMTLSIENYSYYPVEIVGLNHERKKEIISLNPRRQILNGDRDTITIDLPRSFENLFVSKKKKVTGFLVHKHMSELFITYRTFGSDEFQYQSIIPFQEKEMITKDIFRTKEAINDHKEIVVNEINKTISFKKDSVTIASALIIPQNYKFLLRPGAQVNLVKGGKIISYAQIEFRGTKQNPIKIYSEDKKGEGLIVLSAKTKSTLNFVTFDGLTNPKHGAWNVTGAVSFYESPVQLSNVTITNNHCEDALNIIRTNFTMNQCTISDTQSDAFDGDFVNGEIINCTFRNLGNDAIDVSGSDITIKNVMVYNAGDKGLSAGEDSKMTIRNTKIFDSEIAVAGKDLSVVHIRNISIKNTKLAFTAFQKKPEFGPSSITVIDLELEDVETKYLIENTSRLMVEGKKIETSQNVKDRMYGVEFGVSSSETRNGSQQ
ncbi:MAG: right-handed parallel beta-helix repeat-containing protein [Bacteroidia bacterium]|nr:right-handed parallel beta-helix repeat-containing protein [Bacteroidia bacterium]NND25720.1 right-handed parallel beta-helix repeat-containing protein [Flavobacteriaceae bacterium]